MKRQSLIIPICLAVVAGHAIGDGGLGYVYQLESSGSSLAAQDLNGDCKLSLEDIAIALALRINTDPAVMADHDGDGFITGADTLLVIKKAILGSVKDTDGNGIVNVSDAVVAVESLYASGINNASDTDGNLIVDTEDVNGVVQNIGQAISFDAGEIASAVFELTLQMEQAELEGTLIVENCGSGNPANWPQGDHEQSVSQFYPDVHGTIASLTSTPEHSRTRSNSWPANHLYSISEEWQEGGHSIQTSEMESWPANHIHEYSRYWAEEDPDWPDEPWDHTEETSSTWPPNHQRYVSNDRPPDHQPERSAIWPSGHGQVESNDHMWPTNETHQVDISYSWDHNQGTSSTWPPSHVEQVSGTWVPTHNPQTSNGWPSGHSSYTSSSWPPNSYPGIWPPNHNSTISGSWGDPPPVPPGMFPPGHSYVESAAMFLPLLDD